MKTKITHKETICRLIKVPYEIYDDVLLESFWQWCQIHGQSPNIIQQLLLKQAVFNWFKAEIKKCEIDFLQIAEMIDHKDLKTLRKYYKASIETIQYIYPSALIKVKRKNENFSKQYIDNLTYFAN